MAYGIGEFSDRPFGETIRIIMDQEQLAYWKMAVRLGISQGYVWGLVHGKNRPPKDEYIELIAYNLEVRPDFFLEYRLRRVMEFLGDHPTVLNGAYSKHIAPRLRLAQARERRTLQW
jgi:transcriptional regulator with XRE-family HTH domain